MDELVEQTISDTKRIIEKYGFNVTGVGTSPPFAYTSGLFNDDIPELLISGLPMEVAHGVLTNIYDLAMDGLKLESGMQISDILGDGYKIMLLDIDSDKSEMHLTRRLYGDGFPALAVILPDKEHRWPWQDGVDGLYLKGQEHVVSLIGNVDLH